MNSGKPRRSRKTTEPGRRRSSSTRPTATVWPTSTSAMRDLEIRGAGNLLGTQQSGHIATVGNDLYCRLLEHAVRGLKALPPAEPPPVRSTPTRSPIPTSSSPACGRSSPWLPLPLPPAKARDAFPRSRSHSLWERAGVRVPGATNSPAPTTPPDARGEAHRTDRQRLPARVPRLWRRHPPQRLHHRPGADPEDPHASWRAARAATARAGARPADRLGRARAGA
jgi:hypothetical protein